MNNFEKIGILLSIGLMAVALFLLRVDSTNTNSAIDATSQPAAVALVEEGENDQEELFNTLAGSLNSRGEIGKLVIDDVLIGSGDEVADGDRVEVHYVGTLENGQQFDNSYNRGETFNFTIGEGRVIEGWELGLIGMKEGGKRILVIPSDMAYGNQNVGPIPANSTLIFAIELISINE